MAVQTLKVRIITPKQVIFNEDSLSISSTNTVGKFDILPTHANFITLIQNSPIIIRKTNHQLVTFKFPLAIIYTVSNKVNIYTDIELPQI